MKQSKSFYIPFIQLYFERFLWVRRGLWSDAAAVKTAADVRLGSEKDCIGHRLDFKGAKDALRL